ncbi:hypothetical protein DFJ74DRAFT_655059 [Hyaloraphidium curvatum]|nr:hypothetical protein DFJ74DRAFT_655059 [Hyaloraphidium curvatum]
MASEAAGRLALATEKQKAAKEAFDEADKAWTGAKTALAEAAKATTTAEQALAKANDALIKAQRKHSDAERELAKAQRRVRELDHRHKALTAALEKIRAARQQLADRIAEAKRKNCNLFTALAGLASTLIPGIGQALMFLTPLLGNLFGAVHDAIHAGSLEQLDAQIGIVQGQISKVDAKMAGANNNVTTAATGLAQAAAGLTDADSKKQAAGSDAKTARETCEAARKGAVLAADKQRETDKALKTADADLTIGKHADALARNDAAAAAQIREEADKDAREKAGDKDQLAKAAAEANEACDKARDKCEGASKELYDADQEATRALNDFTAANVKAKEVFAKREKHSEEAYQHANVRDAATVLRASVAAAKDGMAKLAMEQNVVAGVTPLAVGPILAGNLHKAAVAAADAFSEIPKKLPGLRPDMDGLIQWLAFPQQPQPVPEPVVENRPWAV